MLVSLLVIGVLSTQTPGGFTPILPEECVAESAAEGTVDASWEASCFVGWLYGPGVQASIAPLGEDAGRVFSLETAAAIRAARARTADGGGHPALDAIPCVSARTPQA